MGRFTAIHQSNSNPFFSHYVFYRWTANAGPDSIKNLIHLSAATIRKIRRNFRRAFKNAYATRRHRAGDTWHRRAPQCRAAGPTRQLRQRLPWPHVRQQDDGTPAFGQSRFELV